MNLASHPSPITFFDLACGTGVVTKLAIENLNATRELTPQDQFTGFDLAPKMLEVFAERISLESWSIDPSQITLKQGDMKNTNLPGNTYSHLTCNFGPVISPNPEQVLRESYRLLRQGGIAGWTAWVTLAWYPDVQRALNDIRDVSAERVRDGTATPDDEKLARMPLLQAQDELVGLFAGIDIRKLRAQGESEDQISRWDRAEFFRKQVEEAGFVDVRVEVVRKEFWVEKQTVKQMTLPVLGILRMFWTEQEKETVVGVGLEERIGEWWDRNFEEGGNGKVFWDTGSALVVTGRKS